jgi:uncharacterized caspase-like protein
MVKNWAIAIGINDYSFLPPLRYAKQDAQAIQSFLGSEAGFERIFFFADDSPPINGKSTHPSRANLLRLLRQIFAEPFMEAGDNFWFFFSGHGIRHHDRDYLMPTDGDPEDVENTAIPIHYITERLRRCGADNVVLILDACRNQNTRTAELGIGKQTAAIARQTGVISLFSCSPNEFSYEVETLQHGVFTCALLEGLGTSGHCATVEGLNRYLAQRVPELGQQFGNPPQTPYVIAEPMTKQHLILLLHHATSSDIATLKNDAYRAAQIEGNLELSEQLWIRVLAAASGQDMEAVKALQRIAQLRLEGGSVRESGAIAVLTPPVQTDARSAHLPAPPALPVPPAPSVSLKGGTLLVGHTAEIRAIAISADGQLLASGSADQTARLWNVQTGELLHLFHGHTNLVTAVAFSPTEPILATGSGDNTIKLWDYNTGSLLGTLSGHSGWVLAIAFSPNSKCLVSGSADGSIKIWDIETQRETGSLQGHLGWVNAVAITPNGDRVVSGSHDKTIKLWQLETRQLLKTLSGHTDRVSAITLNTNGETLLSSSLDGTVKLWQLEQGKLLRTFSGHLGESAIAFSPNGKLLASGGSTGTIKLWQLRHGKLLRTLSGHLDEVSAIAFSPDGKLLASGSHDRTIQVWTVPTLPIQAKWSVIAVGLLLLMSLPVFNQVASYCSGRSLEPNVCFNQQIENTWNWVFKQLRPNE